MGNNSKNFGQVVGMYVGTTAPDNQLLIWYDSTPSQKYHKIYDPSTSSWVALNPEVVTNITYSEIKSAATRNGLPVGKMYKLTDKSNVLAISLTSTKIQYVDTASNYIVDDLASSKIYHISSDNLTIDGLRGVFNESTGKLNFPFAYKTPDFNLDYFFGKVKVGTDWMLAKFSFTKLISQFAGNSLSWKNGLFFNFSEAINSIKDKDGGIVSKSAFNSAVSNLQTNLNNVGKENQKIAEIAQTRLNEATTADQIYGKQLPSAPTAATATDIVRGDTLSTIVNKVQRYINRFKYATGIYLSADYVMASSALKVNNNDTVQSAIAKMVYYQEHPLTTIYMYGTWNANYGPTATSGDPVEITGLKAQNLFTILDKYATWLLSIIYATKIPNSFTPSRCDGKTSSEGERNSTSWRGKNLYEVFASIGEWLENISMNVILGSTWQPDPYTAEIKLPLAGDNYSAVIAKLSGKFNQIGNISNGVIESKNTNEDNQARTTINLNSAKIDLRSSHSSGNTSQKFATLEYDSLTLASSNTSVKTKIQLKQNGSIIRVSNSIYDDDTMSWGGLVVHNEGFYPAIVVSAPYAKYDAYIPRLRTGMLITNTAFVTGSDYSVTAGNGTFCVFSDTTERNIWLPANPQDGTIVYVTRICNKNCNVFCTAESNNGIDIQGSSSQYITIGTRGRIYFFIFVSGNSYSGESRMGLWEFGYMNQ